MISRQQNMQLIAEQQEQQQEFIKPYMIIKDKDKKTVIAQWDDFICRVQTSIGLVNLGYIYPSQIQYHAIPAIKSSAHKDVLCQARSGMGKTAIFLISLLQMIHPKDGSYTTHQCIIVTSSRQLVNQIYLDFIKLSQQFIHPKLIIRPYIGGTNIQEHSKQLIQGDQIPHVLICTVGRLRHLIKINHIKVKQVNYFIIDECDQILKQQNSREDIKYILKQINPNRKLMMFTATLNNKTKQECLKIMKQNPLILELSQDKKILPNIKHYYTYVSQENKVDKLTILLDVIPLNQAIIFVNRIDRAVWLADILRQKLYLPTVIHSKMPQADRLAADQLFKKGGSLVIVATDLFGRGIDVSKLDVVINFDFPKKFEEFQHRAARTGRFGHKGLTVNMIQPPNKKNDDQQFLKWLIDQKGIQFKQLPTVITADYFE